jgi:hypothetical protein
MGTTRGEQDQDGEPPTPDGTEPKPVLIDPDDPAPGSDPNPEPGSG